MTDRPIGMTVRNWDLPDDGSRALDRSGLDRVADQVWDDEWETDYPDSWPAEILMSNGPNIVVHSREEHDAIRKLMAQNARLAARDKP